MLVAVTESISQLKRDHFHERPATLDRFQSFDEASRGPWGSFRFLTISRFKALLASLGAIITICGLAIEQMAQQILEFPSRDVVLLDDTAMLGMADTYYSRAFQGTGDSTGDADLMAAVGSSTALLSWQSSVINGLVGRVAAVNFTCPAIATGCRWPDFMTLSICSQCKTITEYDRNCTDWTSTGGTSTCDYTGKNFPLMTKARSDWPTNERAVRMLYDTQSTTRNNRSHIFSSFLTGGQQDPQGIVPVKAHGIITLDYLPPEDDPVTQRVYPDVDIVHCQWDFCIRDYKNVTADGSSISQSQYTSESVHTFSDTIELPGGDDDGSTSYFRYFGNETGREVWIAWNAQQKMWRYMTAPLNTTMVGTDSRWTNIDPTRFDFGNFMYNGNITQIASDIADTLTHEIRSSNLDGQAATLLQGEVLVTETYINVRWPWLILPATETILATVLLLWSMWISRKSPLWKSSALAAYYHPLRGWNDDDLGVYGHESVGSQERLAEKMTVALQADTDGRLRMLRK